MDIPVLFEDDQILVINKPPNLVTTPAESVKEETLSDILINDFKINLDRGGVVHRLDKDTSGVVIVAKSLESLENLQFQFKERLVKKEYIALVHGFLEKEEKVLGSVGRNPRNRERFIVLEDGKEAETEFKPVERFILPLEKMEEVFEGFSKIQFKKLLNMGYQNFTLVNCFPKTGRTHQIRVHLKYIGFPILGDDKYSGRKVSRLDKRWCKRQFLHAGKITFYHPKTGEGLEFESPLPKDLEEVLKVLEKV